MCHYIGVGSQNVPSYRADIAEPRVVVLRSVVHDQLVLDEVETWAIQIFRGCYTSKPQVSKRILDPKPENRKSETLNSRLSGKLLSLT